MYKYMYNTFDMNCNIDMYNTFDMSCIRSNQRTKIVVVEIQFTLSESFFEKRKERRKKTQRIPR